ncbi:MAG: DUF3344 domain-containing protein [Methanolinea sp.]|jgi:hypothetical protein
MHSRNVTWLLILLVIILPAAATYAGDRPLETVYTGEFPGDYWYSVGNSTYRGSLAPGEGWQVATNPEIPLSAGIRYQRLYVYWTWSRLGQEPVYPELAVYRGILPLQQEARYMDHKGFTGTNDYYTGMDSYEVPTLTPGAPTTFTIMNTATDTRTVSIYGAVLLVVWEDSHDPMMKIWVKEGSDLLYSCFGISPEIATSTIRFEGTVGPARDISGARLFLAAPSGGYSRENIPGRNALMVNRIPEESLPASFSQIFSVMFPGYQGKVWNDVFGGDEMHQIGIEEKEISRYLRVEDNHVEVRDQGDYLLLTNAILKVTKSSGATP